MRVYFRNLKLRRFVELAVSIGSCWGAFSLAKYKLKNIHQRPLRLLRGELSLIPDFQT